MVVVTLTLGLLQTNCYLVADEATGDAVVVDPADDAPAIARAAQARGWTIHRILATHAHFDHILGVAALRETTGVPFSLHRADLGILGFMQQSTLYFLGVQSPPPPRPDSFLEDGDIVQVGGGHLQVLFTPGHSPGGISFYDGDRILIAGDCLFAGSIGRSDIGGDFDTLIRSIRERLFPLGDGVVVYPGHGPTTTIGVERRTNPFVGEGGFGLDDWRSDTSV
jgi:glyoxylase-like metal-dependent hydrolase (beta-lactamase superfamily II)